MKHAIAKDADKAPRFWRDAALPFIEARSIADGREVCYTRHSHEHFSIGAITAGRSTYVHEQASCEVATGTVVLMNPGDVHACNPIDDQPWSYLMLYVDYRPFACTHTADRTLFDGLNQLYELLLDAQASTLQKHSGAVAFFTEVQIRLNPAQVMLDEPNSKLERAAEYIREHCTQALKLEDICTAAELSASYLIRAFKQQYGMTPHAYLVNRRIQFARQQLRQGRLIADVALDAGFADQAHFQRVFKQHLAATPGQYRG